MIMKRIITIFIVALLITVLAGCAKCISTEYSRVTVTILNTHYSPARLIPVLAGKTISTIPVPADYTTVIDYGGILYEIDGASVYHKCSNKVGKEVIGVLETKTYDDGTVRTDIISIE